MSDATLNKSDKVRQDEALLPPVDVIEDATGITLYADLPGIARDGLELRVDGENLTIEGTVTFPIPDGMEASYVEVDVPRFRRTFTLSRELDSEKVQADYRQGVLKLLIPKKAHAQPRVIPIQLA